MGDILKTGLAWLSAQRTSHMAGSVVYARSTTTATVAATYGSTEYEVEDESGFRIEAHMTDFLILAIALTAFGDPEIGDTITADGRTYEVMELSEQGHWRWSDPYQVTLRIHTKEIG